MTEPKPHYRATADGPVMIHDGLQNVVSGLGTRADKRHHNSFQLGAGMFNFAELEAAYMESWIARQIVQVPVDDALREWRDWQCEEAADIRAEESRLRVAYNYKLARYWSRLYGGAGILMVTDQPLDEPLDPKKVKKGGLKRLVVLDRWELAPQLINYTDPISPDYLEPAWFAIRGGAAYIHSSHIIRVDGEELPRRLRALNESWGDSRLRLVLEDLKDIVATKGGIASLVQEANVDVVTRNGLSNELASDQEGEITKRYALGKQMQSFVNMLLLDGEETYERKGAEFSGLGEILDRFMTWISGAADIPATRLFGRAPQGENATGEGDLTNYYDSCASMQEAQFRPDLEKLDEVMVRSAVGDMPEDCEWTWQPLYQESGTELAQQNLADAQSEDIRLNQGTIQRSHVMQRLKSEGRYAIEDDEIERVKREEEAEANGAFDPEPDEDPYGGPGSEPA